MTDSYLYFKSVTCSTIDSICLSLPKSLPNIFIWFADYHSFLPSLIGRLLGKKVYIVIGGYDAAKIKELNFLKVTINIQGQKNNEIRNWTTGYS